MTLRTTFLFKGMFEKIEDAIKSRKKAEEKFLWLGGRGEAAEISGDSGDHQRADGGQPSSQAAPISELDDDIPF